MLIAIYSRKSKWTGKGESVENQLTMCREYLTHVLHIPQDAKIIEYEDEGFSGKNTKRPGFLKMLKDMEEAHFDYLVCYKLDRLGRNLLDLTTLMEKLERENTSFISIKERFDTTTPIGKAMLYFSGVLAQMEREQIGERVKDNMLMLARSGRWLGGNTPYGYTSIKVEYQENNKMKSYSKLKAVQNELQTVRKIFSLFQETCSLNRVRKRMEKEGYKNRRGNSFTVMGIRDILVNPVYCCCDHQSCAYFLSLGCQLCVEDRRGKRKNGFMAYGKTNSRKYKNQENDYSQWILAEGRHKGLICGDEFIRVQKILSANKEKGNNFRQNRNKDALCSGLLYCSCGYPMRPKYYPLREKQDERERVFFYLCRGKENSKGKGCSQKNVKGNDLDKLVWKKVMEQLALFDGKGDFLIDEGMKITGIVKQREYLRGLLEKIEIFEEEVRLTFSKDFHNHTISFPHPLGPTMAMNSPGKIEKEISSSAFVSPESV